MKIYENGSSHCTMLPILPDLVTEPPRKSRALLAHPRIHLTAPKLKRAKILRVCVVQVHVRLARLPVKH